jgi:hypothetical protein
MSDYIKDVIDSIDLEKIEETIFERIKNKLNNNFEEVFDTCLIPTKFYNRINSRKIFTRKEVEFLNFLYTYKAKWNNFYEDLLIEDVVEKYKNEILKIENISEFIKYLNDTKTEEVEKEKIIKSIDFKKFSLDELKRIKESELYENITF